MPLLALIARDKNPHTCQPKHDLTTKMSIPTAQLSDAELNRRLAERNLEIADETLLAKRRDQEMKEEEHRARMANLTGTVAAPRDETKGERIFLK